jgi:hypothetical protein
MPTKIVPQYCGHMYVVEVVLQMVVHPWSRIIATDLWDGQNERCILVHSGRVRG